MDMMSRAVDGWRCSHEERERGIVYFDDRQGTGEEKEQRDVYRIDNAHILDVVCAQTATT